MSEFTLFVVETICSLTISGFVIHTLSDALYKLILELCGTEARARFWISYLNVMLVITPLLSVFMFGKSDIIPEFNLHFFKNALNCILAGMFVSLSAIGFQMMQAIPKKSQPENDTWQSS